MCRLEAWERFHKVECQQLDLILDATLGKMAMLAMRILTSSGKIYLDYIISKLEEEGEARKGQPDSARKLAFNEEDIYDSAGAVKILKITYCFKICCFYSQLPV